MWYWGGKRRVVYSDRFTELWSPNYKGPIPFTPDVVFSRGGFKEYDRVFARYPSAFKIYYGAGRRFMPCHAFKKFDLILVDTPKQVQVAKAAFPSSAVELFVKPAADNVFKPQPGKKKYDVIFVGNEHPKGIKGQSFALPRMKGCSVVHVGICRTLHKKFPKVHFTGWIPRKQLPALYGESKIAVVAADQYDSCPRVIPEALACGCPLLSLDSVRFWQQTYITPETGRLCSKQSFESEVKRMVNDYATFSPYEYYKANLSLSVSAQKIRAMIK